VGGLLGIGLAVHPDTGHDLITLVSSDGHGLFDAVTGDKLARDWDWDWDWDRDPDLDPPPRFRRPLPRGRSSART
jgi:hypothetical protein